MLARPVLAPRLDDTKAMTMEQNVKKIEKTYDSIAREYAEKFLNEHDKKPKDQEVFRRFVKKIGNKRPVWDFGCGPGYSTKYLTNLGLEISGLDLSEKTLEQARAVHPELSFRKGNILELDFDSASIAGIVAFYAIVHFAPDQVGTAFREIFRVLKPGGLFLLTFHIGEKTLHVDEFLGRKTDIDFMFFTTDFIRGCLEGAGFERLEIIEREPYPDVEYESRRAYVFAKKPVAPSPPR